MKTLLILVLLTLFATAFSIEVEGNTEDALDIMDTIKQLGAKLSEKSDMLKTLADAVKLGGAATEEEAKKAMDALKKEIEKLREEIISESKKIFGKNPKNTEDEEYVIRDVIDALKAKIGDLKEKAAVIRDQIKSAAGEKKLLLKEQLAKIQNELKGALADLTSALRELFGRNPKL